MKTPIKKTRNANRGLGGNIEENVEELEKGLRRQRANRFLLD